MEQLNSQQPPPFNPMRPPMTNMMPPGLGNPANPQIPGGAPPPFGSPFPSAMRPASTYPNEQDEKKKQFARGVFVSGFEKCVTTAMIQHHFSIKPIHGLKHPMTKFKQSKGFAFIYYGSEDDAMFVKKNLDRTAILKEKVRITRTVISQNLSKMMFKLKTHGFSEKDLLQHEAKYFNDENLEKEVERIIKPLFGNCVEVNKITIPRGKTDKRPLRYARVFFYVSDVKEAKNIAEKSFKSMEVPTFSTEGKNEYEIILNYISDRINSDEIFARYAKSEIYEYTKKNQSNVLHLKGVKTNPNEDPAVLADELKEFIQKQGPQWNIANVYASIYEKRGAWANVTFTTYDETIQAYQHLKNLRPKFRDCVLYGSLRNVKDPRTVVVSVVRKDVTEKDVQKFLNELAAKSVKINTVAEQTLHKYDYFSFNIIESKTFFKVDGDETKSITESEKGLIHPSWIEINEVPRRLIIHFFHEFNDEDIKELNNDITVTPGYEAIFLKGDSKKQLRSNHQKGHVNKDGVYIKHTEMRGKKKVKQPKGDKPMRRPMDPNQRHMQPKFNVTKPNIDFGMGGLPLKGAPKIPANMNLGQPGQFRPPQVGMGSMPGSMRPPPPQFGSGNVPGGFKPPVFPNPLTMTGSGMTPPPPKMDMPMAPQPGKPMGMPMGLPPMGLPPMGLPPMGQPPLQGGMTPPPFGSIPPPMNRPPVPKE